MEDSAIAGDDPFFPRLSLRMLHSLPRRRFPPFLPPFSKQSGRPPQSWAVIFVCPQTRKAQFADVLRHVLGFSPPAPISLLLPASLSFLILLLQLFFFRLVSNPSIRIFCLFSPEMQARGFSNRLLLFPLSLTFGLDAQDGFRGSPLKGLRISSSLPLPAQASELISLQLRLNCFRF